MGKGDRKSKKGKIHRGTYGKRRHRKMQLMPQTEIKKSETKQEEKA